MNNAFSAAPEVLFAENLVEYYGQPIGLVVAKSQDDARSATKLVKVTYSNVKKPILTIEDALAAKSFHNYPYEKDLNKGDATSAIENSKHKITGEFNIASTQFNFYLEVIFLQCACVNQN